MKKSKTTNGVDEDEEKIGVGERRMLGAIAQHGIAGVTRPLLSTLLGFTKSTRNLYLQRLHRRGFVEYRNGRIYATSDGGLELGVFEVVPTGAGALDYWLKKLPEGEAKLLKLVAGEWPRHADPAKLDVEAGFTKSTRNLYLQRLKRRSLITRSRQGVRMVDDLVDASQRQAFDDLYEAAQAGSR